jgi:hypothetical protein
LSWATDGVSGTDGRSPETVKTAVQDVLNIQGPGARQPVQYNPQTGVLTVRGTARDMVVIGQVLNEIRQAQPQATALEQLRAQLTDLKAEVAQLKQQDGRQ